MELTPARPVRPTPFAADILAAAEAWRERIHEVPPEVRKRLTQMLVGRTEVRSGKAQDWAYVEEEFQHATGE